MKRFGEHLAELRKRVFIRDRRLTQEMLADKLGMSTQQIRKYEQGKDRPSPLVLRKMCQIFDVSADTLLFLKTSAVLTNYDQLNPIHKNQIKENITLLLAMEAKRWKDVPTDEIRCAAEQQKKS